MEAGRIPTARPTPSPMRRLASDRLPAAAVVAVSILLVAATVCARASASPLIWQQWQHLAGVFDVSGPASDGSLIAAGSTMLSRVTPDGQITAVDPAYTFVASAEEYIAVSPGLHLA